MRCTNKKGKKLKPVVVTLFFLLISSTYAIGELDLFGEEFSPSYDIKIKDFDYTKNDQQGQPSGSFSFEKFKVITNDVSIDLNNATGFYDADIYVSDNLVGFKGEAARFVYRVSEDDFKYVNSFRWIKMANLHFLMDRDQIVLNGHRLAMQEPRTYLVAQSFDLNCGRHPEFLLNNGDGFLAGCLNFSDARALQGEGFGIDYRFSNENEEEVLSLQGYFTDFKATQENFTTSALNLSVSFQEETEILASDVSLKCAKNRDLIKIDEESLLTPCLSDFELESSQIDVKMSPTDKITISSTNIVNDKSRVKGNFSRLIFSGQTTSFSLRESSVDCGQPAGLKTDVSSYIEGCLDDVNISGKQTNQNSEFSFVIDDKTNSQEFYMNMRGSLSSLKTEKKKIKIKSPAAKIDIDRYMSILLEGLDWSCHKKEGLREFDLTGIIDFCKLGSEMTMNRMKIIDFENREEPVIASILPKSVVTINNRVKAKVESIYLGDIEDFNLIKNLDINCEIIEDGDIFSPDDLITGCTTNSIITIPEVYSQESNLRAEQLLSESFNIEAVRINDRNPSMSDIKIDVTNGILSVSLKYRVLGGNKKVSFSGPVVWDKEKDLITIDIQNSKLPLGIQSKTIFMMILKKFLVSEMVTVPSKNKINIHL